MTEKATAIFVPIAQYTVSLYATNEALFSDTLHLPCQAPTVIARDRITRGFPPRRQLSPIPSRPIDDGQYYSTVRIHFVCGKTGRGRGIGGEITAQFRSFTPRSDSRTVRGRRCGRIFGFYHPRITHHEDRYCFRHANLCSLLGSKKLLQSRESAFES